MRNPKFSLLCICAVILSGCQTTPSPEQKIFVRTDGKRASDSALLTQQFELDRTICIGEAQKVSAGAAPVYTDGSLVSAIAADNVNRQRGEALVGVLEGCMASKGYVYVPVSQAQATHDRFKANPIPRPT